MKALNSSELLDIWEEGMGQPLLEKTLHLLSKAGAGRNYDEVARLSIGDRDVRLLQLREWMFGNRLKNKTNCPNCGEAIEWETNAQDLHLQSLPAEPSVKTFYFQKDEFNIHFRLPDTIDMLKVISNKDWQADHRKIINECILEVTMNGEKHTTDDLPQPVWEAVSERMGKEDPQADIRMNINCPHCSHQWEARFDIVSFLWAEINNWAQRVMQEVYVLARSFGWSEKDILNMSAYRRQLYIQMLGV